MRGKRSLTFIAMMAGVLLAAALTAAGQQDARPTGFMAEARAALAAGDSAGAGAKWRLVVETALLLDSPDVADRLAAEAAMVHMLDLHADNGQAEWRDWLVRIDSRIIWPRLRALLHEAWRSVAWTLADLPGLRQACQASGVLSSWSVVGPFANERGAGFALEHGPEKDRDPNAVFTGKDRRVAWRVLPFEPPDGVLRFAALMAPSNQAIAFATTAVHAPTACEALLWIGVAGGHSVSVNGVELVAEDVVRDFAADQRAVPTRLLEGWNHVLVKIAAQDDAGEMLVRLTRPDGTAAAGWTSSALPEDLLRASRAAHAAGAAKDPDADSDAKPPAGAAPTPAGLADAVDLPPTPATALDWAAVRARVRTDRVERRATAAQLLAMAEAGGSPAADLCLAIAQALDVPVRIQAERDENRRLEWLARALEANSTHVVARSALTYFYAFTTPLEPKARAHLTRWLEVAPRGRTANWFAAMADDADIRPEAALQRLDELLLEHVDTPAAMEWLVDQRLRRSRVPEATRLVEAYFDRMPGVLEVRQARANLLRRLGDIERLERQLQDDVALNPQDPGAWVELSRLSEGRGDLDAAVRWLESGLGVAPDARDLLWRCAELRRLQGDTDRAVALLDRLLEVLPNDKNARRYREFLDVDNAPFEDRFALDIAAVKAAAPDWRDNPNNDSHRFLVRDVIVSVNTDGTHREFERLVVQILNDQGARQYDTMSLGGGPGMSVRVKSARVHRQDGTVSEVESSGGGRVSWIDPPKLAPGDLLEVAWRKDELFQSFFGNYFGHEHFFLPGSLAETKSSRFVLLLPKGRAFRINDKSTLAAPERAAFDDATDMLTWEVRDLARIDAEAFMPSLQEVSPRVQVSSHASWDELAAWWWNLIKGQYVVTDEMRRKVAELVAGATTTDQKVDAVYDFVVNEVRYVAWEFGVHGYKPYKANTIFERRFGDCKDKAILLNAMLAEIGIKTHPVLIRMDPSRPLEDLTLPMVEHFNHCIAYLPAGEDHGARFLDGTAEHHAPDLLPLGDRSAAVIVVKEGMAEALLTPGIVADEHVLGVEIAAELAADGTAKLAWKAVHGGLHGPQFRAAFETEAERAEAIERRLGARFGKVTLLSHEVGGTRSANAPATLECTVAIEAAATVQGGTLSFRPVTESSALERLISRTERKYPIVMPPALAERERAVWRLPPGFVVAERPNDVVIDDDFGHFVLQTSVVDGALVVVREFWLKTRRVEPGDYPAFRDFCNRVLRAESESVTLRRGEK